jgi:hypothetical protein
LTNYEVKTNGVTSSRSFWMGYHPAMENTPMPKLYTELAPFFKAPLAATPPS